MYKGILFIWSVSLQQMDWLKRKTRYLQYSTNCIVITRWQWSHRKGAVGCLIGALFILLYQQYYFVDTQKKLSIIKVGRASNISGDSSKRISDLNRTVVKIVPALDAKEVPLDTPERDCLGQEIRRLSKISIIGKKTSYRVGDIVKLYVKLYERDCTLRSKGGDILRVRIFEDELNASASGQVLDHHNGSYTAIVKCLWTGTPTIQVYLVNTAEVIESFRTVLSKIPSTRPISAVYTTGVRGVCHPMTKWLTGPVCNLTEMNGGMSWYCEAPNVQCSDVVHFERSEYDATSDIENALQFRYADLQPAFKVRVKGFNYEDLLSDMKPPCHLYNKKELWSLKSPIGYFYQDEWKLMHCSPASPGMFNTCLRNKHLVLYGDSTVRQWFQELMERFNCQLRTEEWSKEKWQKDSQAYCSINNLTIDLFFHSLPGNFDNTKLQFHSIAGHILQFSKAQNTLILIYLQNHFNAYHPDVFLDRLKHVHRSTKLILRENPDARIFIKGGQSYWGSTSYMGDMFRSMLTDEFADIQDKVTYIDNMDMTTARLIKDSHPPIQFVSYMVTQWLGYVCS